MEEEIRNWCDNNLALGMCYGSNANKLPIAGNLSRDKDKDQFSDRQGKLVYQDGTACSASHAFADVYQLENGDYEVYMDYGSARFMGDSSENKNGVEKTKYSRLSEVVDYLGNFSGHDPNSCGELIEYLCEKIKHYDEEESKGLEIEHWFRNKKAPILAKSGDNTRLIEDIRNYGSRPYNNSEIKRISMNQGVPIPVKCENNI